MQHLRRCKKQFKVSELTGGRSSSRPRLYELWTLTEGRSDAVVGSFKDPLPGWVDNLNGPMALYAAGQKGVLRAVPFANAVDTIPVDSVTQIILLASWLKGLGKPIR